MLSDRKRSKSDGEMSHRAGVVNPFYGRSFRNVGENLFRATEHHLTLSLYGLATVSNRCQSPALSPEALDVSVLAVPDSSYLPANPKMGEEMEREWTRPNGAAT